MKTEKFLIAFIVFLFNLQTVTAQPAMPTQWQARGVGGGGAVYSPSINPHDSNDVYLSCDMGLMMRSKNFGVQWETQNFDTLQGFRNSFVNFTNHPDTFYVMKFDGNSSRYIPAISKNRGLTWDSLQPTNYFGLQGGMHLYANPYNSRQVMVAGWDKIYFSNNWGSSFTLVHSATTQGNFGKLNLAGVHFTNDTIFACTDMGLLLSTNNGNSWQYFPYPTRGIPNTEFVMSFAGASRNGAYRFFCTTFDTAKLDPRAKSDILPQFKNIYKLDWSNNFQWQRVTDSLFKPDTGSYNTGNKAFYVLMNANNPDTFYLTGQTKVGSQTLGTVFRSNNGGIKFARMFLKNANNNNDSTVTGWYGGCNFVPSPHAWTAINSIEGLAIDPNNVMRLMSSDYSGTHTSTDGGNHWQQCYTDTSRDHAMGVKIQLPDVYKTNGQQTTVCYWVNWSDSLHVQTYYADLLMNASNDGGSTWDFNHNGLWSQRVNDIHMVAKKGGRIYVPEGEVMGNNGDWSEVRVHKASAGKIAYSADAVTWTLLKDFGVPVSWICFDPNDSTKMYVACYSAIDSTQGGIWRCDNPATNPQWTKLNAPPRTEKRGFQIEVLKDGTLVAVFGPRNPNNNPNLTTFNYTASSGVFLSTNGGNSWTDLTPANDSSMKYDCRYLTLDPSDTTQRTWLVSVGNNGAPAGKAGLYRTTNRGQSWTNIMPAVRVNTVTFNPQHPTEMYVCTERNGLWYATNANTDTLALTKITSYAYRSPQRVFFNPYNQNEVWITSIGNSMRVGYSPVDTLLITSTENTLPVELIAFDVYAVENTAQLQWETAIEINNEKFEVERSSDGILFQKIGEVQGNGNSTSLKQYSFTDEGAHDFASQKNQTVVYYRLKQIDFDGAFEYNDIEAANFSGSNFLASLLFPNPAQSNTRIEYELSDASGVEISIYDLNGREILALSNEHQTAGKHFLNFNTDLLTAGIYFVRMNAGGIICKKLMKQ